MKRIALLVVLVFLFIGQAQAEKGGHYYLANLGYAFVDVSGDPDPLMLASLSYGYGFSQKWALEVDYTQSFSGGEYENSDGGTPPIITKGEYSLWALSVNAAYRHLFKDVFYFKGKIGYTYGDSELTSSEDSTKSKEINSLSGALGVGYLAGAVVGSALTLELMLAKQTEDLTSIMIGANVTF